MASPEPGTLYVVATPIGNLEDLSPRGREVLASVPVIACEDTRRTGSLLKALGIAAPELLSYREQNERRLAPRLVERLRQGTSIALVSDAGTPTISDPGYHLVRACRQQELPVVPIPGPSALATAVSAAGLPSDRLFFLGFLPPKKGARRRLIEQVAALPCTLVVYLPPHSAGRIAAELSEQLGSKREAVLCRELTKRYEEFRSSELGPLATALQEEGFKGEATLLIGPPPQERRVHHNKYAHLAPKRTEPA